MLRKIEEVIFGLFAPRRERPGTVILRQSSGCGTLLAFAGLLFLGFLIFGGGGDEPASAPVAVAEALDAATIAQCRDVLRQGEATGAVRKIDRAAQRLYVDEALWREIGPDARVGVAGAALCEWHGIKIAASTLEQRVVVVSWQSGQRLASISSGMYFDRAD